MEADFGCFELRRNVWGRYKIDWKSLGSGFEDDIGQSSSGNPGDKEKISSGMNQLLHPQPLYHFSIGVGQKICSSFSIKC